MRLIFYPLLIIGFMFWVAVQVVDAVHYNSSQTIARPVLVNYTHPTDWHDYKWRGYWEGFTK